MEIAEALTDWLRTLGWDAELPPFGDTAGRWQPVAATFEELTIVIARTWESGIDGLEPGDDFAYVTVQAHADKIIVWCATPREVLDGAAHHDGERLRLSQPTLFDDIEMTLKRFHEYDIKR